MNEQPTHLDLFSGIGGFALAAEWAGFKTIGFCEIDKFCQGVLKKHWPEVPIHENIKELRGGAYAGCTLLTGGFPCQPFSQAGKRRGKNDDRHLWPEMLRVIDEAKPTWIVGENVVGIISMELDQVCLDLEAKGYEVQPIIIPACAVDAPHKRDRVWLLANSKHDGFFSTKNQGFASPPLPEKSLRSDNPFNPSRAGEISSPEPDVAHPRRKGQGGDKRVRSAGTEGLSSGHITQRCPYGGGENVADSKAVHVERFKKEPWEGQSWGGCRWLAEPRLGRVADGIPNRAHRLKGLGNAIVPQVAYQILKGIRELL